MIKLTIQAFYGKGKIETPAFLACDRRLQLPLRHRHSLRRQRCPHRRGLPPDPAAAAGEDQGIDLRFDPQRGSEEISKSWDLGNKVMATIILVVVLAMYLYFSFWLR